MLRDNIIERRMSYITASNMLFDRNLYESILEASRLRIQRFYKLDERVIRALGRQSVDIIPWDIALCWAYGMNWHPRPVFQSYIAYTQKLDSVNSLHFSKKDPPTFLLYSYKSIDGQYPLFDEPETFRSILLHYEQFDQSGEFLVLRRKEVNSLHSIEEVDSFEGKLEEFIPVPKYDRGFLFGSVHLSYSLGGEIKKIFWRPSSLYIQFEFEGRGRSRRFQVHTEGRGEWFVLIAIRGECRGFIAGPWGPDSEGHKGLQDSRR